MSSSPPPPPAAPQPSAHRGRVVAAALALVGLVATLALWRLGAALETEDARSRLERAAFERQLVIAEHLAQAVESLHEVAAFYAASQEVREDEFATYVRRLRRKHRAAVAIGWAAAAPPGPVLVRYLEPVGAGGLAPGVDLEGDPAMAEAIARARGDDDIAISGRLALAPAGPARYGVLAVLRLDPPPAASGPGATAGPGFAIALLRVADIVESGLRHASPPDLPVLVFDRSAPGVATFLHAHGTAPPAGNAAGVAVPDARLLDPAPILAIGGRRWQLVFDAPTGIAVPRAWLPLTLLVGGLFLTLVLVALTLSLSDRAAQVEAQVVDRTSELARVNRALGAEVEERGRAERELQAYRGQLERLVDERTAALHAANLELQRQVAQRRLAEEAHAASEERLRLILDAVSDGGWDWIVPSGTVFFSDSWVRSLGFERDHVEATQAFRAGLIHPDDRDRVRAALDGHLAGATATFECEYRLRTRAGDYRWRLGRGQVVLRGPEGRALRMVGTDTDITERRRQDERQRRLEQQLRQTQKLESLGLLAGGIAHDFNNLLVGIIGGVDLALLTLPADAPGRDHLERVRHSATRTADLTREMLAYSGRGKFQVESVDLSALVAEMTPLVDASISKRAALQFDFAPDLPPIRGDATQLRQVVMNLIINASEAIGDASGTITIRTGRVEADRAYLDGLTLGDEVPPGRYVCLEVLDTGSGMDEATRSRVFDPFFSTKQHGRGLGLAAVLGIVRGHRGAVGVDSSPGRGTTFRVLLPWPEPVETAAAAPLDVQLSSWRGHGTVLVVDDEEPVRHVTSSVLRHFGFDVLLAGDGVEGVEAFRRHADAVVAVVLDMTMPRMSGDEAFRRIRAIRPDVPVILCSGYSEQETVRAFAADDLAGFVQKPYGVIELVEKLRRVLGG